MIYKPLY